MAAHIYSDFRRETRDRYALNRHFYFHVENDSSVRLILERTSTVTGTTTTWRIDLSGNKNSAAADTAVARNFSVARVLAHVNVPGLTLDCAEEIKFFEPAI